MEPTKTAQELIKEMKPDFDEMKSECQRVISKFETKHKCKVVVLTDGSYNAIANLADHAIPFIGRKGIDGDNYTGETGAIGPTDDMAEERKPKYKEGDKVKIVHWGHPLHQLKSIKTSFPVIGPINDDYQWVDMSPEIVGKTGTIDGVTMTQGTPNYSIEGIPEKDAWYQEG